MKDRLKFRGFNTQTGKHVDLRALTPLVSDLPGIFIPDNGLIVEQCTGLRDDDGVLIYEGDILSYRREFIRLYSGELIPLWEGVLVINWKDTSFYYDHYSENRLFSSGGVGDGFNDERAENTMIRVIGSIHKNPELIPVK